MKALIVYHSYGGNTKELAQEIERNLLQESEITLVDSCHVKELNRSKNYETVLTYDVIILGSNTWGDGDLPKPMARLCDYLNDEQLDAVLASKYTAVFGTGETGYAHYCESVNQLASLLNGRSKLIVSLKVEQIYGSDDLHRITAFTNKINARILSEQSTLLQDTTAV